MDPLDRPFMTASSLSFQEAPLQGIYGFLTGISLALLFIIQILFWKRPTKTRSAWIFYLASTFNLTILLCVSISGIKCTFKRLSWKISSPSDWRFEPTECTRIIWIYHDAYLWFSVWLLWPRFILISMVLISDGTIVYRVGVLSQSSRRQILLGSLWMASLISGMIVVIFNVNYFYGGTLSDAMITFPYIFVGSSILSNLSATICLASLFWRYRRLLRVDPTIDQRKMTLSQGILGAIFESGIVYCMTQIVYLAAILYQSAEQNPFVEAKAYSQALYAGISGMYPAIVLLAGDIQKMRHGTNFEEFIGTMSQRDSHDSGRSRRLH